MTLTKSLLPNDFTNIIEMMIFDTDHEINAAEIADNRRNGSGFPDEPSFDFPYIRPLKRLMTSFRNNYNS